MLHVLLNPSSASAGLKPMASFADADKAILLNPSSASAGLKPANSTSPLGRSKALLNPSSASAGLKLRQK